MNRTPAAVALLLGCAVAAGAAGQKPPTIGDLTGRKVEVRTDDPVPAGADRAKTNYQEFLGLGRGDPALRAEAMRRLGDLKLESGEQQRLEQELAQESPLESTDAILLYTKLLAAFPDYPRNDAVLYQLARAYEANQQGERALAALDEMVGRYPASRYRDEAEFRRGEVLFSARRWTDAEGAYAAVITIGPRSEFFEQSLYKHGWSLFKHGDTEAALGSFAKLLDRKLLDRSGGERDMENFSRPERELVEDTLRVVAIVFSFDDDSKGVDAFLQHHGDKPYAHLLYATLGDLYVSKERWTDAANAYRAFAHRAPDDEHAPLLTMQAIGAYRRGGFASLVVDGKREFVESYGLKSPYWAKRKPADAPLVVRELKTNIKDLAAYFHAQAQKSKLPADYQEAARWYREYLQSFPDDAEAPATSYLLADALFESHQYREAALEYEHAAYGYPPNAKSATAGYAALVAFEKAESALTGDERGALHHLSLESGVRFATTFQDHPESAPVLVRTAREFYDLKDYPKAIDVADIVLARRPPVEVDKQRTAWTVIANGQFELGQFDKAEGAYLQVVSLLASTDPQRSAIEERIGASVYKQAEARKAAGDEAGAVDDFLRVGQLAPGAKLRATADYDAAALLIGLKDWPRAIAVLEAFRRNFAASELQPEVTRKLAVAYLEAGRPGPAAREFERIAAAPGGAAEVQREALQQAAVLYEQSGDVARTVATLDSYVKRYPEPFVPALEARQKLADFAGKRGDAARRAQLLEEIVRADANAGGERSDRSRYLAARAALELAAPARNDFNALQLKLPLKKSLEAKRAAMQRALKAYGSANDYAVAEVATAATFEMAELYRHLAEDLLKSERPRSLKGDALEQYDVLLEEQAYPFEEKAIEVHLVNTARAAEGIYDASVRASFASLAKLKPARFAKAEQGEELVIDIVSASAAERPAGPAAAPAAAPAASRKASAPARPPAPAPEVPVEIAARFQRAVAAAGQGDSARALREFTELMALTPPLAGPAINLGILSARGELWQEAQGALTEALKRSPANATAAAELGVAERALGHFADAERAYRRALESEPNLTRTHRNLGVLLDLYLQKPEDALAEYQNCLELEGGEDAQLTAWIAEVKQRLGAGRKNARAEESQ